MNALKTEFKKNEKKSIPEMVISHHLKTLLSFMQRWKQQGYLSPVILFTGQRGIGKKSIVSFLAQWVFCLKNGLNSSLTHNLYIPCGECISCQQICMGNYVDLIEINSFSEENSENPLSPLKIEPFRQLKDTMGFGSHQGLYKVIFIPNAERMTPQASNSILKLLEEPPPGWIFFLTADDPTLIPSTLLSRCQILRLKPFPKKEMGQLLESFDPLKRNIAIQLSQGSWSRAFLKEEIWTQRQILFQFLKNPQNSTLLLLDWVAERPEHLEILISFLEHIAIDCIRWSIDTAHHSEAEEKNLIENYSWIQMDAKAELAFHVQSVLKQRGSMIAAQDFWIQRAESLFQARIEILTSMNKKLLAQNLLLGWISPPTL